MIKLSRVTFTFEYREVPQKWGIRKSHQNPSLFLSFWVNFPPFIHVAPLKFVSCHVSPALMGSFSDPTFTLQVSFLNIQGPYSYLATSGAGIFFVHGSQRSPVTAGKRWGRLGTAPPSQRRPRLSPPLLSLGQCSGSHPGQGDPAKVPGQRSVSQPQRESGGGGGGIPGVKTPRD